MEAAEPYLTFTNYAVLSLSLVRFFSKCSPSLSLSLSLSLAFALRVPCFKSIFGKFVSSFFTKPSRLVWSSLCLTSNRTACNSPNLASSSSSYRFVTTLCNCSLSFSHFLIAPPPLFTTSRDITFMEFLNNKSGFSSTSFATSSTRGGRGRGGSDAAYEKERMRGRGKRFAPGKDKIDALGRLMTRILRHMASELNLNMRSDGYVEVQDLLKLNLKTFVDIPLRSHTIDDVMEAVQKDNKQRFSLLEENGKLFIRANQGHTLTAVQSESLLKPILSAEEVSVCVHGTYKRNLKSILESGLKRMKRLHVHFSSGLPTDGEVISGMRRDVNVLIFLDVGKALEDGMKLYVSDNKVILTEGFDGAVPIKYFKKMESWPDRQIIPF